MTTITTTQMDSIMEFFAEEAKRKKAEAEARAKHKILYAIKDFIEAVKEYIR